MKFYENILYENQLQSFRYWEINEKQKMNKVRRKRFPEEEKNIIIHNTFSGNKKKNAI